MKPLALIAIAASLAACHPESELGGGYQAVVDVPPQPIDALDILFVVDNSGSMAAHQDALVSTAGTSLFAQIDAELGDRPDLHVAVISSDIGAGQNPVTGCLADGDDGRFSVAPQVSGCAPPTDNYILDIDDGMGGRTTNYSGTIGDAFQCIAPLGTDGCGFEQPLEAMRRALDGRHPEHAGFLRDEALLLVVFVTDEDDCSAFAPNAVFDVNQTQITDPLGPLTSFRCFEFGMVCNGDDPRTPGAKTDCVPRDTSAYLTPPAEYVTFLQGLKSDPSKVMVAGILGDAGPIVVGLDNNGNPQLTDVCAGGNGAVFPAPRLHAVLEAFPARYDYQPICNISFSQSLSQLAKQVTDVMSGSMCLWTTPMDTDASTPGVQPRCRAYDVGDTRTEIPRCKSASDTDCFTLISDSVECGDTSSQLRLDVRRSRSRPAGTRLVAECAVAPAAQ